MKDFIENNGKTIINILIFIVFFLPVVITLYSALLGSVLNTGQILAVATLFGIGALALSITSISDI